MRIFVIGMLHFRLNVFFTSFTKYVSAGNDASLEYLSLTYKV